MPALDDDSKVMDVSKPGKGKISSTSRPVIKPVVDDKAADGSVNVSVPESEPDEPLKSPSASHKVIKPISEDVSADEDKPQENSDSADQTASEPESDKPAETEAPVPASNDEAASVEAVVSKASEKKEAAKKAEEQAKKDAELQKLIDSKKYFVPISRSRSGSSSKLVIVIIAALLILVGGYLLADVGVFGSNLKLPVEFFKESTPNAVQDSSAEEEPAESNQASDETDNAEADEKPAEDETDETTEQTTATPEMRARDTDRKNELKNLQQKLETYYNDNGNYPSSLSDPELNTDTEELTDPSGTAYQYETDGSTYTLYTVLESASDPETDADGRYVLFSVN